MSHGSKLTENKSKNNIHLNIAKTFDFIEQWLPQNYTKETNEILKEKKDPSYIRAVKTKRIRNKKVYTALYMVALKHKNELDQIVNEF